MRRGNLKKAKEFSYGEFQEILDSCDTKDRLDSPGCVPESTEVKDALAKAIGPEGSLGSQAVLGIDVYRYSELDPIPQSVLPFVLRLLYSEAYGFSRSGCPFLFHDSNDELREHFIDTGDGGFQLLETPVQALVFALEFETILRSFNSYRFYPGLRSVFRDDITVRYAMTYGTVFAFDRSYYGPGIIDNSRLLGRDRLNRCLIDQGTLDWFTRNTGGVENLGTIGLKDLQRMPDFKDYDAKLAAHNTPVFPVTGGLQAANQWKDVDVLRIGAVSAKERKLQVYSLHVHFVSVLIDEKDHAKRQFFTVTLGNLNSAGIADS